MLDHCHRGGRGRGSSPPPLPPSAAAVRGSEAQTLEETQKRSRGGNGRGSRRERGRCIRSWSLWSWGREPPVNLARLLTGGHQELQPSHGAAVQPIWASPGAGPGVVGEGHLDNHVLVGSEELGKAVEAEPAGFRRIVCLWDPC